MQLNKHPFKKSLMNEHYYYSHVTVQCPSMSLLYLEYACPFIARGLV